MARVRKPRYGIRLVPNLGAKTVIWYDNAEARDHALRGYRKQVGPDKVYRVVKGIQRA